MESFLAPRTLHLDSRGTATMIQTVLLAQLGVVEQDPNGYSMVQHRDPDTGLPWLVLVHAEPGDAVVGQITRRDPGTMGRTLFHFRSTPRDGRHGLDYITVNDTLVTADLPALTAVCAFFGAAWAEVEAGRTPDLEALMLFYLDLPFTAPPVEIRPGDREIILRFEAPE